MVHRAYLQLLYRLGGIEAVNSQLLRAGRVEPILKRFGAKVADQTVLHGPLVIHNAGDDYGNLSIGRTVHIGRLVVLDLTEPVVLEDDTVISMGTTILTHSDVGDRPLARRLPRTSAPIRIGPAAYIGANATILPGCDIGAEAVIGAGAVVTHPVPDGAIVTGVPARSAGTQRNTCSGSVETGPREAQGVDVVDDI